MAYLEDFCWLAISSCCSAVNFLLLLNEWRFIFFSVVACWLCCWAADLFNSLQNICDNLVSPDEIFRVQCTKSARSIFSSTRRLQMNLTTSKVGSVILSIWNRLSTASACWAASNLSSSGSKSFTSISLWASTSCQKKSCSTDSHRRLASSTLYRVCFLLSEFLPVFLAFACPERFDDFLPLLPLASLLRLVTSSFLELPLLLVRLRFLFWVFSSSFWAEYFVRPAF